MKTARRALIYIFLFLACALYLIPVYVLLVTGLKGFAEVNLDTMWNFPSTFSLDSFVKAWVGDPLNGVLGLSGNFANSLLLVIPATLLSAMLGSMNGYVLSKWKFRGSDTLFTLFLFGMFIPYQSILIPLVQTLRTFRQPLQPLIGGILSLPVPYFLAWLPPLLANYAPVYGTIGGLVLVHVVYGIPITTLIFRNYYATVPDELLEAGRIDGAGFLGVYRHIMFPISLPGFVVVLIWQFTNIWNDFLFAVTITYNPAAQPITVALNNLAGSFVVEWNVQMAGALMAALPTLLVYILMGRFFMRGLLAGSVKG